MKRYSNALLMRWQWHCIWLHLAQLKMKIEMKKFLLVAMMAAPVFGFAQSKPQTQEGEKQKAGQFSVANPEAVHLEVIIAETSVGSSIRVDYGREQLANIQDKDLTAQLTELRSTQISSVPDITAYLSSIGFKYISSYQIVVGGKNETHLMFEKRLGRRAPNSTGGPDAKGGARPQVEPTPVQGGKPSKN